MAYIGLDYPPQDQAARVELLSNPRQQTDKIGIGRFVLLGGSFNLSDMSLRHVVVKDTEVHYTGGAAILDDVIFINCRFVMNNVASSRQLAKSILESQQITLKLG